MNTALTSRRLSRVALSLGLMGLASASLADVAGDKEAIRDNYAAYVKAVKARDAAGIIAMEAPDYTDRDIKGRVMSKQEVDAMILRIFSYIRAVPKAEVKIESLSVKGATAVAVTSWSQRLILVDPNGKDHVLATESRDRDTWVNSSSGWHIRTSQSLSISGTVDGRKLPSK